MKSTAEWIDGKGFREAVFELVRLAACELPTDVEKALCEAKAAEEPGSSAELTLSLFLKNIEMAKERQAPVCQDTGLPIFFINHPDGVSRRLITRVCQDAVAWATTKQYLRHNAVDSVTGKNSGNNIGEGFPAVYFTEWDDPAVEMTLILKGGGSENVSGQYSMPYAPLDAGRDLEGVRRVVIDAVRRAEGKGCPPGILGVCIGGDRGGGYAESKHQLLRRLEDVNPDPTPGRTGRTYPGRRQPSGDRSSGAGRKNHPAGGEDRQAPPRARLLLRHHQLHVLGVPATVHPDRTGRDLAHHGMRE